MTNLLYNMKDIKPIRVSINKEYDGTTEQRRTTTDAQELSIREYN